MHTTCKYWIACILTLSAGCLHGSVLYAQSISGDSSSVPVASHAPIYRMNYWLSGSIDLAAAAGGLLSIPARAKPNLDSAELANVNPNNVPSFDRWSLHQNPALVPQFETYSEILQIGMGAIPLALLFDSSIRQDGLEIMMMGLEVNAAAILIYTVSPLGPLFETRYRPIVYYPTAQYPNNYNKTIYTNNPVNIASGQNKNSFYSGHVASASAASFFMAKVYCDYHPDANKYLVYGIASVPALTMSYVRLMALDHFPSDVAVGLAVGTLCGVLIPELHKIGNDNLSMGIYTSPTSGTGLALRWTPQGKSLN